VRVAPASRHGRKRPNEPPRGALTEGQEETRMDATDGRSARSIRSAARLLVVALAMIAASSLALAQKTTLVVYTAIETDQLKPYELGFAKAEPDIELKWVRDSTGIITAKLLAEKASPQADVIWGVAASSLAALEGEGMLLPYAPKGYAALSPQYCDAKSPPAWWGMDVYGATVCFNTVEAAKRGIPKPETWKDLAKPVYKGQIAMPNPASSGTGFLDVVAWLQMYGEAEGWSYMDALHQNVGMYTHSGSKPCRQAGAGEFVVGLSFDSRANHVKSRGLPIELVFPKEGIGWDVEGFAIVKGTKHLDAAKKLADWAASRDAMSLYAKNFAIVALPGVAAPLAHLPPDYEKLLIKSDFLWAAKNRERILAEWTKRYGEKAEKP
jgi:iron(III) transport system substrate-binding protein